MEEEVEAVALSIGWSHIEMCSFQFSLHSVRTVSILVVHYTAESFGSLAGALSYLLYLHVANSRSHLPPHPGCGRKAANAKDGCTLPAEEGQGAETLLPGPDPRQALMPAKESHPLESHWD